MERVEDSIGDPNAQLPVHYFGCCPRCRGEPAVFNVGKANFMTCPACRVGWSVGWGLFSGGFDMTEEERRVAMDELNTYERIEPPNCPHFDDPQQDGDEELPF